ncbi:NAD(P)/FAD-dependent oxidoreductase [Micromonospora sp. NPDC005206]|uniref:flavin-containing monooxygenase n=1 Tax=Micromonospora sp. NPDC005206 TaxID=3157022 RepID=UPI0033ABF7C5
MIDTAWCMVWNEGSHMRPVAHVPGAPMTAPAHRVIDLTLPVREVDPEELRSHLRHGDAPLVLMSLVQMTGDLGLLDRFGPHISIDVVADSRLLPSGRIAEPHLSELIDLVVEVAARPTEAYLQVPDDDLFNRMLSLTTGTEIPAEFNGIVKEQGGFVPATPSFEGVVAPEGFRVAVLGSGMSGIHAAIALADAGIDYDIFEQADDIGGTWRINTYPGVAVDTPSIYYSFSYEIEPKWSKYFPLAEEYQGYLRRVVDKYDVKSHIQFETRIEKMTWDEDTEEWVVQVSSAGHKTDHRYTAVITAAGFLNRAKYPDIPGIGSFRGEWFHTTEWPADVDLIGKRVGIIGAGATSVQVVDGIIDDVAHLTLFQRQPHWVMPNHLGEGWVPESEAWLQANLPFYDRWQRAKTYWFVSDVLYDNVRVDPEWVKSHELSISAVNDRTLRMARGHLEASFKDRPDLMAKMTPDFPPNAKRIIRDPGRFYSSLTSDKGSVVTERLAAVTPEGLQTADGVVHELDVIIYATGFTLDFLNTIEIIGRNGRTLNEEWKNGEDPRSYLGGTVAGFPNLFVTSGPNSSSAHGGGHNYMTEVVTYYIMECLKILFESGARSIEVNREAQEDWVAKVDEKMEGSIWRHALNAHTYYRNAAGRVFLSSPWRMVENWQNHHVVDHTKFEIK